MTTFILLYTFCFFRSNMNVHICTLCFSLFLTLHCTPHYSLPGLLFGCYLVSDSLWVHGSVDSLPGSVQINSVARLCPTLCNPNGLQHPRLPCPSPTPRACSNSCPSSQWYHLTISSSVIPFSSRLQSFPASGSFPMSRFFTAGGQSIGVLALASVLPVNIQDWFPSGWTGRISLLPKGCSRVFSNTTFQKCQFFNAQLPLWSNSHIHPWLLEKTITLTIMTFVGKAMSQLFNILSRFVIAFLPRSKCLLISWL